MKSTELEAFLKNFAAQANNIVLKGQYTGEDMVEAAEFTKQCRKIFSIISQKTEVEKNEEKK